MKSADTEELVGVG